MYHGKKRLNYTKLYNSPQRCSSWEPKKDQNQNQDQIAQAILEHLKENLPSIIRKTIDFKSLHRVGSISVISLKAGSIIFKEDRVTVSSYHCSFSWFRGESRVDHFHNYPCEPADVSVEYSDPELFTKLETLIRRHFNYHRGSN